jgi:hypothetical protein
MKHAAVVLALLLIGCRSERPSEIVRKVEVAGAGDLRAASKEAIEDWFRKHPDVANETRQMCVPVRANAPANWGDSTEGRVCNAANVAAAFQFRERKGDGRGFDAVR